MKSFTVSLKDTKLDKDGITTRFFSLVTAKGTKLNVSLFQKGAGLAHGFEAFKPETTNESGFYRTGGLEWHGNILDGYDGCYCLPDCIAAVIAFLGYKFGDHVLENPIQVNGGEVINPTS